MGDARVRIVWDSGAGFNDFEQRDFILMPHHAGGHEILVEYTGEHSGLALGEEVVLTEITVDGRPLALDSLASTMAPWSPGQGIRLTQPGASVRLERIAGRHLRLGFQTNTTSGLVRVTLDGQTMVHDLYMANWEAPRLWLDWWFRDADGHFSLNMGLPRHAVRVLALEALPAGETRFIRASVRGPGETRTLEVRPDGAATLRLEGYRLVFLRWFSSGRFAQQVVFALLTSWLLLGCQAAVSQRGGVRSLVLAPHRRSFWLMFLGMLAVFGFWLAAFWPGVMSVDSLRIWRGARLPEIMFNDHPMLNIFLYRWLQQLWDHVAIVPLAQISCTAGLISWILYRLHRRGIGWVWLIPSYFFLLVSVPVGLYSVTLWKDIPFALLILFWAFTLGELRLRHRAGNLSIGWGEGLALLLMYLAVGSIRHNGVVYLLFIPCVLLFLGLVPRRRATLSLVGVSLAALLILSVVREQLQRKEHGFFLQHVEQMAAQLRSEAGTRLAWSVRSSWRILDIHSPGIPCQDVWHAMLADRHAWWFLARSGWSDVYRYEALSRQENKSLQNMALKIYHASLQSPWVYLTWNPFWLLPCLPISLILGRLRPEAALLSATILAQVIVLLVFAHVLNWRYYYFVCLSLWFLPPLLRGQRGGAVQMHSVVTKGSFNAET